MSMARGDETVPEWRLPWADLCEKTVRTAMELRVHHKVQEQPGSQVRFEYSQSKLASDDRSEATLQTWSGPLIANAMCEEGLMAMSAILRTDWHQAVSLSVLARSIAEWAGRSHWIATAKTPSQRLARGLTEYIFSLWEGLQTMKAIQDDENPDKELQSVIQQRRARLQQEKDEAEGFGFKVLPDKANKGSFYVEEKRPSPAQLFEDLFSEALGGQQGRLLWKHFSSLTHGSPLAHGSMYSRTSVPEELGFEHLVAAPAERPMDVERPVAVALLAFFYSYLEVARSFGWDSGYWTKFVNEQGAAVMDIFRTPRLS